ncbi:hypothetical protein D3C77_750300 [compost metagenome]
MAARLVLRDLRFLKFLDIVIGITTDVTDGNFRFFTEFLRHLDQINAAFFR